MHDRNLDIVTMEVVGEAMQKRIAKVYDQGKRGWEDEAMSALAKRAKQALEEERWLDAAVICGMLAYRGMQC